MEKQIDNVIVLPKIAILDNNTLACIGLKHMLLSIMPKIEIDSYSTFSELSENHPETYYHFFVSLHQFIANKGYFTSYNKKTIVMTVTASYGQMLSGFHCLNVNVPEQMLIKELLTLEQGAHARGNRLPVAARFSDTSEVLSSREIEVLVLIVKGFLNKEIADKLNISLSTVVTHRRNIMDKLDRHSVGSLTIYAVMHGYVSIGDI